MLNILFLIGISSLLGASDLSQILNSTKETLSSIGPGIDQYVNTAVIFDPTALDRYRELTMSQTISKIDQKKTSIDIVNDPSDKNLISRQIQVQMRSSCVVVDELRSLFNIIVEDSCNTTKIKETCFQARNLNNVEMEKIQILLKPSKKLTWSNARDNHDRLQDALKKIAAANMVCTEEFSKLRDRSCLNVYERLFNQNIRSNIANRCSPDEVKRLFDDFLVFIKSSASPFSGFIALQGYRAQGRESEFQLARLIIELREIIASMEALPTS